MPPRTAASRRSSPSRNGVIRVAIVDDSTVARAMIGWALEQAGMEVAVTASNGREAIAVLPGNPVDVLILDLEMPGMNGLSALPEIIRTTDAAVLVVSSLTTEGARSTIEALRLGAADTLAKPSMAPGGSGSRAFGEALVEKVRGLGRDRSHRAAAAPLEEPLPLQDQYFHFDGPLKLLAIAASTGGPSAMFRLMAELAPLPDVPVLVTQHLPPQFVPVLAEHLGRHARRRAVVAEDGQLLRGGTIHIAPGTAHLGLETRAGRTSIRLLDGPASSGCKPSADPMFEAVARCYGATAIGIVLSGMGRDGAEGALALRQAGGAIIAQDQCSSVVWGMPGAVARLGIANTCRSPSGIAALVNSIGTAA